MYLHAKDWMRQTGPRDYATNNTQWLISVRIAGDSYENWNQFSILENSSASPVTASLKSVG